MSSSRPRATGLQAGDFASCRTVLFLRSDICAQLSGLCVRGNSQAVTVGPNNFDRNPRYAGEEKPETTNAIVFRDCADCSLTGFTISRTRAAPAALTLEKCDRFNVANLTILDSDGVALLLKDVANSRVAGCLIRDDRPNAASVSLRTIGGHDNMIVDNYLGRPSEIQKDVGLVERNYDAKVKP
jgi:hypothetical protein